MASLYHEIATPRQGEAGNDGFFAAPACLAMTFLIQSLRQRMEKPFAWLFAFRLTVALLEFKFRLQALLPDSEEDQKLALESKLAKDPLVFRLPARRPGAKIIA